MQLRLTALILKNIFFMKRSCKIATLPIGKRLLLQLTVTAHEAVDTTCCIDKLALTGIERVRGA